MLFDKKDALLAQSEKFGLLHIQPCPGPRGWFQNLQISVGAFGERAASAFNAIGMLLLSLLAAAAGLGLGAAI